MALDALITERADVETMKEVVDFGNQLICRYPAYRRAITGCILSFGNSIDALIAARREQGEHVTLQEVQMLSLHLRDGLERVCREQLASS